MINSFIKRVITGVLFVAILAGCIPYDAFSLGVLFTVISILTIYEFTQLVSIHTGGAKVNRTINMLGEAYLFLAIMGFCINVANSKIFIPYMLLSFHVVVGGLYLRKENPVLSWTYSMLSQLYIGLSFALLDVLAFHDDSASEFSSISYSSILPLSIFIFLWLNDTGVYCIGLLIGKHRLFGRISPEKSWEGSIDSGVIAVGMSFIPAHYFPFMPMMEWIGLTLAVAIFGTWGDPMGPLLKRQLHIKSSGNILPGHGGMLDRLDSSLMATPAAVVYSCTLT